MPAIYLCVGKYSDCLTSTSEKRHDVQTFVSARRSRAHASVINL